MKYSLALGIALGLWGLTVAPAAGLTWQEMSLVEQTTIAMLANPRVSGLDAADIVVDVREGTVVLRGAVQTEEARRAAAEVAQEGAQARGRTALRSGRRVCQSVARS